MADILVIGYGNELRRDDGLGPNVARRIAAANYAHVRVLTCFQLVPELAADLAETPMAIFMDALDAPERSSVELQRITAEEVIDWNTHTSDPRTLLALTRKKNLQNSPA